MCICTRAAAYIKEWEGKILKQTWMQRVGSEEGVPLLRARNWKKNYLKNKHLEAL